MTFLEKYVVYRQVAWGSCISYAMPTHIHSAADIKTPAEVGKPMGLPYIGPHSSV